MSRIEIRPRFIQGSAGRLFVLSYVPAKRAARGVLLVPPFGEELNKSRRMFHLVAAELAGRGVASTLVDLYGTGDSEGEFRDASWEQWLADVDVAATDLRQIVGNDVAYLGLRMGAMLALEHASRSGSNSRLVFWHPWIDGHAEMSALLKMRVAADKFSGERRDASVAGLRQEIEAGHLVEVGGYEWSARLFAPIDGRQLAALGAGAAGRIDWLDLGSGPEAELSQSRAKAAAALRPALTVETRVVAGARFWSTVEIETSAALVDATAELLVAG